MLEGALLTIGDKFGRAGQLLSSSVQRWGHHQGSELLDGAFHVLGLGEDAGRTDAVSFVNSIILW